MKQYKEMVKFLLSLIWFSSADLKTCNCISIHILPQQRYYAGNG